MEKVELIIQAKDLASQAIKALTQAMDQVPQKQADVNAKLKALQTEANQFVAKLTNDRISLAKLEKEEKLRQLYSYYKQGLISTQQYHDSFKAINKKMQESATESSFFDKLKKNWLAVTGAIIAAWALVTKAIDYAKLGAAALQAEASFRQVAHAYGENADILIAKMKKVSAGIIDDSALMQRAVKGLQQGLSGDQIVKILEISRTAARNAGEDIKTAFDGITNAIANQQTRALKNYGIVIDQSKAYERYAEKVGLTVDQLTEYDRTQALFNAVVAEGKRQAEAFGEVVEDVSEKLQRLGSQVDETKETIGKSTLWLSSTLGSILYWLEARIMNISGAAFRLVKGISFLTDKLGITTGAFEEWKRNIETAHNTAEMFDKKSRELADGLYKVQTQTEGTSKATEGYSKEQRDAANEAEHQTSRQKAAMESFSKSYIENSRKISEAIKNSENRIKELTKTIEESDRNIRQISKDIDKDISDIEKKGVDLAKTDPLELYQKARQKMVEAGTTSLIEEDIEGTKALYQEARDIFKELGTNAEYEREAVEGLKTVKRELIDLEEQRKQKAQESLQQEITNIEQLTVKAEELKTKLENLKLKVDSSELDSVIEKYKNLDGSEIRVRVVQEQVSSPAATMARGGFFQGYGGGDRIPVLAEAGEFFHRKEAVRYYGTTLMQALNRMALPRDFMDYLFRNKTPSVSNLPLKMKEGGKVVPSVNNYSFSYNSENISPSAKMENLLKTLASEIESQQRRV